MDLQGQPIPAGKRSTKVTTDPETYRRPVEEPSGPVANDSLAADSARSGGAFSQNRGAEPLGVSGGQSTLSNTDTSGATELPSAPDSSSRGDGERKERYPEALGGQGNFPGAHLPESGYAGGPTQAKREMGINTKEYPASQKVGQGDQPAAAADGYRSQYNAGTAPSYVNAVVSNPGSTKPKGNNLKEGGFPDNPNRNASLTSDIGTRQDPGRRAENKFQRRDQEAAGISAAVPGQQDLDGKHWYQPLKTDQTA